MTGSIDIVRDADCWTFTLNRPDKMNALNPQAVEALLAGVDEAHQSGARTLVFAGNGRNFSAGFDQGNLEQESDADLLLRLVRIETMLQRVASSPCMTVAFAHGRNFGAGVDLFVACKKRFCTADATFRMPGLRFGLVLGTRRFGECVGLANARDILEQTRTLDAHEAHEIGLVSRLVEADGVCSVVDDLRQVAGQLDSQTQRHLYDVLAAGDASRDLADLVLSASRPGLKARMLAFMRQR
ncbi:enoyl-CoA hydratase/isomerase family protein [Trinickia dinghuensis]|uniref:Enoyl-CoA hydratase/isomerase family protein n=1 Tax=Trinickia dinghuensis TaxID=2291023 RepID=A0A3D8JU92_9BURK|nr:enoyl-CoA hydratase/isomerase family protein [Trinickia dinghuensis]RDU96663.1 enoyl-CoA hydratase/isomerase family protein [Trinickia dinghuensis]